MNENWFDEKYKGKRLEDVSVEDSIALFYELNVHEASDRSKGEVERELRRCIYSLRRGKLTPSLLYKAKFILSVIAPAAKLPKNSLTELVDIYEKAERTYNERNVNVHESS
ncbi:MAG: hypothetical protein Q7S74_05840 [Nanoarchaeota archaeon]|nr:hypothetical protein [Nanoarchaeota archaeon]